MTVTLAYLKKQEKSQTNNLILHLKQLEKEERINNGLKTISVTIGAGKTGQPLVKE